MSHASAAPSGDNLFVTQAFEWLRLGLAGNAKAMDSFAAALAPNAVLWLPPTPNTRSPYRGHTVIHELLRDFVVPLYRGGLHLNLFRTLTGPSRTAFLFEDHGVKLDGSEYLNSPCIVLETRARSILGVYEYWGGPRFFSDAIERGNAVPADQDSLAAARASFDDLCLGLAGDADHLQRFLNRLHRDVKLWFPPTPNTRSPYVGSDAARAIFTDLLVPMYPQGLFVRPFHVLSSGSLTMFEAQSFGVRRDGSEYINTPALTLDVRAGEIVHIWEHWGAPGSFDPAVRTTTC